MMYVVQRTSRVTKDEATHGDTQAEDEGPPSQVLDRAIIDDTLILLGSGRVGTSRRWGLGRELGVLAALEASHDITNAHDGDRIR